jgi:hypothetical protein
LADELQGCPGGHMHFTMEYLREQVIIPFLNQTLPEL